MAVGNAALEAGQAGQAGVDTRTYAQLLAGVPAGRCTCATVLDALIGQVAASCCDPADVVGHRTWRPPRHVMPFHARNEGSKHVG